MNLLVNSAYKDKTWEADSEAEGEKEYKILDNILDQRQPAFKEITASSISVGVPATEDTDTNIISR